jgi:glycerol uptake facilitator-like aquaporin
MSGAAKNMLMRRVIAEFIGTAIIALVFLSIGFYFDYTTPWYAAFSVGVALCVLTLLFQQISGAYFNPAYTITLWLRRLLPFRDALAISIVQGAAGLAAFMVYEFLSNTTIATSSVGFELRTFSAELIGTFVLGIVYAAVAQQKMTLMHGAVGIGFGYFIALTMIAPAGLVFLNPAVAVAHGALSFSTILAPLGGFYCGYRCYGVLFRM